MLPKKKTHLTLLAEVTIVLILLCLPARQSEDVLPAVITLTQQLRTACPEIRDHAIDSSAVLLPTCKGVA